MGEMYHNITDGGTNETRGTFMYTSRTWNGRTTRQQSKIREPAR